MQLTTHEYTLNAIGCVIGWSSKWALAAISLFLPLTSPAEKMDLNTPGVNLLLLLAVAAVLAGTAPEGAGKARTERAAAAALAVPAPKSFHPAGRTAAQYANRLNLKN